MQYDLYLFDFDYTLVDSSSGIIKCIHETEKEYQLSPAPDDVILHTIGLPMAEACSIITGRRDEEFIKKFLASYKNYANIYTTPMTRFFPSALPLLQRIKAAGGKTGIISTKNRPRIMEKLLADKVEDLFDIVIGIDDVQSPKPAPEGILAALQRLGVPKDRVLYVGDNPVDAQAAANAAVDFAAVTTGTTTADQFLRYPHKAIMKDLSELPMEQVGILNEGLVFDGLSAATSAEAIQRVGQRLAEACYIKPAYIDAVLEREKDFPTGLELKGMYIAIPHAAPADMVLQNGLAVARLSQPVAFHSMADPDENVEIEMIFMLALKDHNQQAAQLGALFTIFQNAELLKALKQARNSQEIFAILKDNLH